MTRMDQEFNWGKEIATENPVLYRQLSDSYTKTSRAVNTKISVTQSPNPNIRGDAASDPPASSDFNRSFEIGDVYVRTDNDTAWMMTSRTSPTNVTWTQIT